MFSVDEVSEEDEEDKDEDNDCNLECKGRAKVQHCCLFPVLPGVICQILCSVTKH